MSEIIEASVVSVGDREIIRVFSDLEDELHDWSATFSTKGASLDGGTLRSTANFDGGLIDHAALKSQDGLSIQYRRSSTERGDIANITASDSQARYASQISEDRLGKLISVYQRCYENINSRVKIPSAINDDVSRDRIEILRALEVMHRRLADSAIENQQRLEVDFLERSKSLHAEISVMREKGLNELSALRSSLESEHEAKRKILQEDEARLEDLKKSLDDRNNTHVRRSIRQSLLSLTESRLENFVVSSQTKSEYKKVLIASGLIVAALVFTSIYLGMNSADVTGYPEIILYVKSAFLAATAVALSVWFLKWQNAWFQKIADSELRLQQFRLDIERASWLAETVFEWRTSPDAGPYPESLIDKLSAGLFEGASARSEDSDLPITQLAQALIGGAASLKLKIGDQIVELDRKGIGSLSKPHSPDR